MSGSLKDGSNVLPREQCKLDGWWDAQMWWAGTEIFQGKFLSWIPTPATSQSAMRNSGRVSTTWWSISFTPPSTWQGLRSPKNKLSHWSINFQNVEWQCSLIISIHVSELKNGISLLIDGRSNLASGSGHEDWRSSWVLAAHFPINTFETAGPVFLHGYIRYIYDAKNR